jgi:hypothetical protein
MQAFGQSLMDSCGLADTLPPRELVNESDCGGIFDIQGHNTSDISTF